MAQLRVLGTLEVLAATGHSPVLLRSVRSRRLLAALLVRRGEVAPVDWLAEVVWGQDQPVNTEGALQNLVSRLRGTLRAGGGADGLLLTRPPGYLLDVDASTLDAAAFESAALRGRSLIATEPAEAVRVLEEALSLWRGAAFAEFADDDFARPEAGRLEELRTTAVEDQVDALLATGRNEEAIARLEGQLAEHPLRERPHAQLVLARYRAGRQAEALEAYRDYRARLDDELGLEPSEGFTRLQAAVLRQDPSLDTPRQPARDAAYPTTRPSPTVPPQRTDADGGGPGGRLLGRDDDLARLQTMLMPRAVVTLTGPGGVGKTTLATTLGALASSETFPDGVHVLELSALVDDAAVPHAVATTLGVQLRPDTGPLEGLVDHLRSRRSLLVVDNCEHLVNGAAELVHVLHAGCPGLAVLATSRTPLEVEDEQVWAVTPLPVPPAKVDDPEGASAHASVQLFVSRARARSPRFVLDDGNAAAVAEICRRLDGLPLAIELAAVRMGGMSPQDLADRLSWRFRLLHGGPRSAAERHRTLRAVVDWSYDLLDAEQQQIFEVLSVFTGSIALDAAERLVAAVPLSVGRPEEGQVAEVVAGLVDRSMLVARHRRDRTRYAMLETLRVYGAERLAQRPWADDVRRTYASQRADIARHCDKRLYGPEHQAALHRLLDELDDLRAAHSWALRHDLPTAARLVGSLALFAEQRMVGEISVWAEQTLDAAESSDVPVDLTRVLAVAAGGARFRGGFDRAKDLIDRALAMDPSPSTAGLLHSVGAEVTLLTGRLEEAHEHVRQVDARAGSVGPFAGMAGVLESLLLTYEGNASDGAAKALQVHAEAERQGWAPVAAWATYARGEALQTADPDLACTLLEDAVDRARAGGDSYLTGVALVSAASVAAGTGDARLAARRFDEVVEHWHEAGNWAHQWTTLRNVADLLVTLGSTEDGAVLVGAVSTPARSASLFGADAQRLAALTEQVEESLGDRWVGLRERGASLDDESVVALARTALARLAAAPHA